MFLRFRWPVCVAIAMLGGGLVVQPVRSQDTRADSVREYAIDAGPLGTVLSRFAGAAGIVLSFDATLTEGLHSEGLHGTYSTSSALDHLLHGQPLGLVRNGDGTYSLRRLIPANETAVVLDPVRVEGTGAVNDDDKAYTTAGSSTHIAQEKIERFRGTSVGDILQGTPGVLVGENRNSGGLDVNIRGMQGQGRVPVTIDGSRQETTVWRGYAGVASRSYVDPDLIGGIDITKGPTLGADGTGAIGGVVAMRTIGIEEILRDGKTFGVRVRASGSGNNSGSPPPVGTFGGYNIPSEGAVYYTNCAYNCQPKLPANFASDTGMDRPSWNNLQGFAGSVAAGKRFEHFDLVAAYARRKQGNYYAGSDGPSAYVDLSETRVRPFDTEVRPKRLGASIFRAEEQIVNTAYENTSALLKGTFYVAPEQQLDVSYLRYDSDFGEMMPSRINAVGFWAPLRQWIPSDVATNTYTARYKWQPASSNLLDLRANAWHTDMRSVINSPGVSLDSSAFETTVHERYRRWGFDLTNTSRVSTPWKMMQFEYGVTGQLENMGQGGRAGDRSEFSVFASADWFFAERWTLQLGMRYTRYHSQDDNPLSVEPGDDACVDDDGDGVCIPVYYNARGGGAAPAATILWNVLPSVQLYTRYAEGLRMPSLFETTSGWSVSPSFDIHLRPERAKNLEAGMNFLRDGVLTREDKLRAKFAWFRNHTDDYLTRTPPNTWESVGANGEPDAFDFFRLRNIQSAEFDGLELSASYDIGVVFAEVGGSYYTKIEVCHEGSFRRYVCTDYGVPRSYVNNMIPPDWHASAVLGTRLFKRRLTLGVRGTFMGERASLPANDTSQFGFAPPVPWHRYNLLDVFASYRFADRLTADLNVDNVTDQYYLDALSLGVLPAPGRTLRASLSLRF